MKTYRVEGKIISSNRLNNSVNGNPRWCFIIFTGTDAYKFKTATDSSVGYLFKPWCYYNVVVDYHVTRAGNLICDGIVYGEYIGV